MDEKIRPAKTDESNRSGHGANVSGIIAVDSGLDGHGIWGMAPEANQLVRNHTLGGFKDGVYRLTDLAVKITS